MFKEFKKEMEIRDYLRKYGEDCTADIKCCDCSSKEICKQDIEQQYGIVISQNE